MSGSDRVRVVAVPSGIARVALVYPDGTVTWVNLQRAEEVSDDDMEIAIRRAFHEAATKANP